MTRFVLAAACLVLAFAAQPGSAQDATTTPPPPPAAAAVPPPPPPPVAVAAAPSPPPVTAVPVAAAPQAPAVTAAPAVQAPPPVTAAPVVTAAPAPKAVAAPPTTTVPVVTAAPAPQAVATPPTTAAPVVVAAPAPKAVATPPVVAPVVIAAPAPKAAATPPVTAAPVAKAAPAPAPAAAAVAKAAPAPGPSSSGAAVLPGVLPFPRAPTPAPAPAPATPPRMCNNGPPKCQVFIEDVLCCGSGQGLATDSQYLKVDVLCTESVVIPQGCLTVTPTLTNLSVSTGFVPAGTASTYHDYIVDFQKDADFQAGPTVGRINLTLEALRNASSANYNPTCAQAISPCLYNGTMYNQTVAGSPVAVTVLDTLDYIEGYVGLPPTPTDTLGWSTNASNAATCNQQDTGSLPTSFYTGGWVNYTGYQTACNVTRTVLDTYQFCEDYILPYENRTLHNLPPASPAPRVPGPSLGPSSRDGIPL